MKKLHHQKTLFLVKIKNDYHLQIVSFEKNTAPFIAFYSFYKLLSNGSEIFE